MIELEQAEAALRDAVMSTRWPPPAPAEWPSSYRALHFHTDGYGWTAQEAAEQWRVKMLTYLEGVTGATIHWRQEPRIESKTLVEPPRDIYCVWSRCALVWAEDAG